MISERFHEKFLRETELKGVCNILKGCSYFDLKNITICWTCWKNIWKPEICYLIKQTKRENFPNFWIIYSNYTWHSIIRWRIYPVNECVLFSRRTSPVGPLPMCWIKIWAADELLNNYVIFEGMLVSTTSQWRLVSLLF